MQDAGERKERIALNEARFRDVNESIAADRDPVDPESVVAFVCECGDASCSRLVELTRAQYEHVRSDGRWFAIVPGHDIPDAELVVEDHDTYVIVQKRREAAPVVQATDPRS